MQWQKPGPLACKRYALGCETVLVKQGKRRELQCSVLPLLVAVLLFSSEFPVCVLKRKARLMPAHLSVGHLVLLRLLLSGAKAAFYGKIQAGIYRMSVCPKETQGI